MLLLLSVEGRYFEPFMREVVKHPAFAQYPDLVDACLEDSAEISVAPFAELLELPPKKDKNLWERQATALRVVERIEPELLKKLLPVLKNHPFEGIQKRVRELVLADRQDVRFAPRGGYELVRIPAGSFMMGPQHEVHISEFYMGRYPVTNEEYGRFLSDNPKTKEPGYWGDSNFNNPRQPVVGVSWHDAQSYAKWAGLQLPSEAQWEYACRAGTTTRFYTGDKDSDLDRAGWYDKNSGDKLHPVGEKEPNAFGLYDMHGNVWEWVEDDWHDNYKGAPTDGSAWIDNRRSSLRVLRGGSWSGGAGFCRVASRSRSVPGNRYQSNGFRLALLPG
jgi:formylglycine-generating enzyme required for sulfatase activity